jgi:hypothetical protein
MITSRVLGKGDIERFERLVLGAWVSIDWDMAVYSNNICKYLGGILLCKMSTKKNTKKKIFSDIGKDKGKTNLGRFKFWESRIIFD